MTATEKAQAIVDRWAFKGPEYAVKDIAQALESARNEALEEAAKVCELAASRLDGAAARAASNGRSMVAEFRHSDSDTASTLAAEILDLKKGGES